MNFRCKAGFKSKVDRTRIRSLVRVLNLNEANLAVKLEVRMDKSTILIGIKILHTIIWLLFNAVLFYLLYAAIQNLINIWVWVGIGLVLAEGVLLIIFKNTCPLTFLARKYSDSTKENFDIYLPNWLAKYNKLIYTVIFLCVAVAIIYRTAF